MEIKSLSEKQKIALRWWNRNEYSGYDAIICDGAVRSGKTLCMFISFVLWAMTNFDGCSFAVCGKTVSSTRRNITTPMIPILQELGFEVQFAVSKGIMTVSAEGKSNTFYLFGGRETVFVRAVSGSLFKVGLYKLFNNFGYCTLCVVTFKSYHFITCYLNIFLTRGIKVERTS
jgi:hypothetical protein